MHLFSQAVPSITECNPDYPHPIFDTNRHFQLTHKHILPHISTPNGYRKGEMVISTTEREWMHIVFHCFKPGSEIQKNLIILCKRQYFLKSFLERTAALPPLLSFCLHPLCRISASASFCLSSPISQNNTLWAPAPADLEEHVFYFWSSLPRPMPVEWKKRKSPIWL